MNARAPLFLALAAVAGAAYASTRRAAIAGVGPAVDWPDAPATPSVLLDAQAVFDDVAASIDSAVMGTTMNTQRLSYAGLQQLKIEEGFSATPYSDHKGNSIGYGHLIKPGEDLSYVTTDQAEQLLASDVGWAEEVVSASVQMPLTPNQFDALVMLAYNIGGPAFKSSTMVRLLNLGDYAGAAGQFPRWVNASGQPQPTLIARRARERDLFEA